MMQDLREAVADASQAYPSPRQAKKGMRLMLKFLSEEMELPAPSREQYLLREVINLYPVPVSFARKAAFNSYVDGAICALELFWGYWLAVKEEP